MGALLPILLPAIPSIINMVEGLFKKPQSGNDKMLAAVGALQAVLTQLVTAKQVPPGPNGSPGGIPEPNALVGIIETVLAQMKIAGTVGVPDAVTPVTFNGKTYVLTTTFTEVTPNTGK